MLYTYKLTGKIFSWSTAGGMNLYTLSTPYKNEYGDWFTNSSLKDKTELDSHNKILFDSLYTNYNQI